MYFGCAFLVDTCNSTTELQVLSPSFSCTALSSDDLFLASSLLFAVLFAQSVCFFATLVLGAKIRVHYYIRLAFTRCGYPTKVCAGAKTFLGIQP